MTDCQSSTGGNASNAASPRITVLAGNETGPPGIEHLTDRFAATVVTDEPTLTDALRDTDILLVTDFRSDMLARAWPHAQSLRWIHAASAGVDQLIFDALRESNVTVTNAQGIFDRSIAEYVLGAILFFAKDTRANVLYQQQHRWVHRDTETITGKRVLVVGAGSIGREIGAICRSVGMSVEGIASRAKPADDTFDAIHGAADLDHRLAMADYVVVAAPLTDATYQWFDAGRFEAMQAHARFINIGRGPIVVTPDLVAALENAVIAGAALDVFEEEPLPEDHPLWSFDNVLISAHMAGDFVGWHGALIDQFLENLGRWRRGEPLFNLVDKEAGYGAGPHERAG